MENNVIEDMGATTAAPTSTSQNGVSNSTDLFVCHICKKCYKTESGLNLHLRRVHEEVYHAQNVPVRRAKARWDDEELVLLARMELKLKSLKVKNINAELRKVLPYRTLESIKGVRRKINKRYHDIFKNLESKDMYEDEPAEPAPHFEGENTGLSANSVENVDWVEDLLSQIRHYHLVINSIDQTNLTDDMKRAIDRDYELWVSSLRVSGRRVRRRPVKKPSGPPRHYNAAKRRKAAYSRAQNLFQKNRSRCAKEVLEGSWDYAGAFLQLPDLEPYWRGIFEEQSVKDRRSPDPITTVKWGIVAPVLLQELKTAMAQMKPDAPGQDGMAL